MGNTKFIPYDPAWRKNKRSFNGNQDLKIALEMLSDDEVLEQLEYLNSNHSERLNIKGMLE